MGQKRRSRRIPFRKRIRLGKTEPSLLGYTSNISEHGLQIESRQVYLPGTTITISFTDDSDPEEKNLEVIKAVVKWSTRTPGSIAGRMGVEFVEGNSERIKQIYNEKLSKLKK